MDILEKALQEWSYRTKKGYPDLNSKEDLDLFESMFGFRLEKNSNLNEDIVEEKEENLYSVDDLIKLLTQRKDKLPKEFITNLYHSILSKGEKLGSYISGKLKEKGLENSQDEIFGLVNVIPGLELKLTEVLKSTDRQINLSDLGKAGNLVSVGKRKTNLPTKFLNKLITAGRAAAGGKGVGNGEAFLALLGLNGKKLEVGDVVLDGKVIEVKGTGGRLGSWDTLENLFKELENISDIPLDSTLYTYIPKIVKANPQSSLRVIELLEKEFNKKFDNIDSPSKFKEELLSWYATQYMTQEENKGLDLIMIIIDSNYKLYTPSEFINAVKEGTVKFSSNITRSTKFPKIKSFA